MDVVLSHFKLLGPGAAYLILLVTSGIVFLAMTLLGFGDDGGTDDVGIEAQDIVDSPDLDDAGPGIFRYLSFRNCVNYVIGFGAGGYLATLAGLHPLMAALCALSGGALTAILMYKFMVMLYGLSDEQPESPEEAVGGVGRVYIEIGPARSRRGKVLVTVKSARREYAAVTDAQEALPVETGVRILAREGDTLVVGPVTASPSHSE